MTFGKTYQLSSANGLWSELRFHMLKHVPTHNLRVVGPRTSCSAPSKPALRTGPQCLIFIELESVVWCPSLLFARVCDSPAFRILLSLPPEWQARSGCMISTRQNCMFISIVAVERGLAYVESNKLTHLRAPHARVRAELELALVNCRHLGASKISLLGEWWILLQKRWNLNFEERLMKCVYWRHANCREKTTPL
jgi:hypothetical protein